MIRMPVGGRISDNDLRLIFSNKLNQDSLMGLIISEESIGHFCIFSYGNTHHFGSSSSFFIPQSDRTTSAQFPLSKIKNSGCLPFGGMFDQSSGTSEFNIVRMRSDREYMQFHILQN